MTGTTLRALAAMLAALLGTAVAEAQTPDRASPPAADAASAPAKDRDAKRAALEKVAQEISLTEERLAALRDEIDDLDKDRATLNSMLIDTAERARKLEGQLDRTESRLRGLAGREDALQKSLHERRALLAEVLAALQRMGRNPPPAIIVRPEDALTAVRSAILLGAVVPELNLQAQAVAIDLKQLLDLRAEIAEERDRLKADATTLAEERTRIELLLGERQRAHIASQKAMEAQRKKAAELATQAADLKDLIARAEREVAVAAAAAEAARKADEERRTALTAPAKPAPKAGSLGKSDRIAPAVAFADAKGLLPQPVNGTRLTGFGEDDGLGNKAQGLSLATRSGARVSSPSDGWVVFAGPFRSYGQLLIINAGGGYHILLAGMERIDVELGQFVLAGEPVAVMGDRRLASAAAAPVNMSQPVLYVEFRKDTNAIDPSPWWAGRNDEKAGG